jgi:putative oxidoreductase
MSGAIGGSAADVAVLVLRLVAGVVFIAHGWNHIFGGGKIAGTNRWFESLGMRPPLVHAWLASLTELGSGILLVLGLLTPLAAAGIVGTMLVAWVANHRTNGFFIFRPGEGYEYVMTLTVVGIALGGIGAGRWSLDHLFDVFSPPGWPGLALTLGVGGGASALLLATCWRPSRLPKPAGADGSSLPELP